MANPQYISLNFLLIVLCLPFWTDGTKDCLPRQYEGEDSVTCVCNATYCDVVEQLKTGKPRSYVVYTSTMQGLRFKKHSGKMKRIEERVPSGYWKLYEHNSLKVNRSRRYQKVFGFGGSFTDAAGINILKLSKGARDNFMQSYFGKDGLEWNMGRVPIGGTDFSTHTYAYNMWPQDDMTLSNFSLSSEDFDYKIPIIKEAQSIATSEIYLIASVWSPPIWMKTSCNYDGLSLLLDKYHQTYADYHIRFLEEYDKVNISFWSLTTGNEPFGGMLAQKMNSLGWGQGEMGIWITKHFGPTVRRSKFKDLKILAVDDVRFVTLSWMNMMVAYSPKVLDYIDGIASHSYFDYILGPGTMQEATHVKYPDKFLISTETAIGSLKSNFMNSIFKGSWRRVEVYTGKLIEYFNHWYTGVLNWNLATDANTGGPTWRPIKLESLIMVDPDKDEFIKLPIFYAFGHFSKFVPRGSVRIGLDVVQGSVEAVAFLRPDNGVTVISYNPSSTARLMTIREERKGTILMFVPARSVQTVVYW